MERRSIAVSGMSCGGCEQNVESALGKLEGVNRVDADHEGGTVEIVVSEDVSEDDLAGAIREAGYEVSA